MKTCDYCGLQNESLAATCAGCGTPLMQREVPPVISDCQPKLNARFVLFIFLVYLGVQLVIGAVFGAGAVTVAAFRGLNMKDSAGIKHITSMVTGPAMIVGLLAAAGVVLYLAISRVRPQLFDTSATGAAWVRGKLTDLAKGFGAGLLFAALFLAFAVVFRDAYDGQRTSLSELAAGGIFGKVIFAMMAILIAPISEELLFRGVMYAGFRNSYGAVPAAVLTTAIFWLMHIGEMIHFWPAMLGIAGFALLALWLRLRLRAIGPSVAAHIAYNTIISSVMLLGTSK